MDMQYAAKLAQCYQQLHEKLKQASNEIDWPVCTDPGLRSMEFLQFVTKVNEGDDEWATYYSNISIHLENLLWYPVPEDKTKLSK